MSQGYCSTVETQEVDTWIASDARHMFEVRGIVRLAMLQSDNEALQADAIAAGLAAYVASERDSALEGVALSHVDWTALAREARTYTVEFDNVERLKAAWMAEHPGEPLPESQG